MGARLRIRGAEWPWIALIAIAVAVPTALAPIYAIVAAGVLLVLGAVVFNAGALLALLVAAFPWDDMLGIPTETVSVVKILGALLLVGYFLRALSRDEDVRLPSTVPWLVAFTMLVLLSLMLSGDVGSGLSKTLRYLLFAAFTFLFVQLVRTRAELLTVVRVLVISSTVAALYATFSFVTGNVERVSGPIGEANDFAYVLASVLPFAIYLTRRDRGLRLLWVICCAVLVLALFGTLSRGALVGLAAVVLWAVATRRTRFGGVLAGTLVVGGVLLLAFTLWRPLIDERLAAKSVVAQANVDSREAYWRAAVSMAADHPILGVGPGRFGIESKNYILNDPINIEQPVVHNSYLEVLAEGGVPTLIVFIAFIVGSWRLASQARRRFQATDDQDGLRLVAAVQASLVVAIVSANFLSVQITVPLWLLGGIAASLALEPPARVKVALVTSIPHGGPVEHAVPLARDLVRLGVSVSAVACDDAVAARFAAAGARVAVLPLRHQLDAAGAVRVWRWTRGADVVHSHDRRSGLWTRLGPAGAALRVHTLHGLPEPYLDGTPGLRGRLLYGGVERALAARTDVLVAPSRAAARLLSERVGYALEDIVVVPNGVDLPAEPVPLGTLVGTLSAHERVKGLDVFLAAVPLVLQRRPQTRFAIYGTGSLEAWLRERARGLPVVFPGHVPANDALRTLAVLALPSFMETSGIALLEAMAAGVPAVASRVGGIEETAPPGAATLIEPGDPAALANAVLALLDDPSAQIRAGRAAAAERTAAATARRMLEVYETTKRA